VLKPAEARSARRRATPKRAPEPHVAPRGAPPRRDVESNHRAIARADPAAVVELARTASRRPLPYRDAMAERFGVPLDGVEVHVGPAARDACELLGARAFAVRNVVAFRDESPSELLVAHELAHVVQQRGDRDGAVSRFVPGSLRVSVPGTRPEHEASLAARGATPVTLTAAPIAIYRDEAESAALLERHKVLIAMLADTKYTIHTYTSDRARFGIRHAQAKPDPVFKESSEEKWARADYVAVARKLAKQEAEGTGGDAGSETTDETTTRPPTQGTTQATTEEPIDTPRPEKTEKSAAEKAGEGRASRQLDQIFDEDNKKDLTIPFGGKVYRVTKVAEPQVKTPKTYAFTGEAIWANAASGFDENGKPPLFPVVQYIDVPPRAPTDHAKSLADYVPLVKDVIAVAHTAKKTLQNVDAPDSDVAQAITDSKVAEREDRVTREELEKLPLKTAVAVAAARARKAGVENGELGTLASIVRDVMITSLIANYQDADELYAQIIATTIFDGPERIKIKGTLFEQWVATKYPNLDVATEPIFGDRIDEEMFKSALLKKIRRGDGVSEVEFVRVEGAEAAKGPRSVSFVVVECKGYTEGPTDENIGQMKDYAFIIAGDKTRGMGPIDGYFKWAGEMVKGRAKRVDYYFPTVAVALLWKDDLEKYLPDMHRIDPDPSAKQEQETSVGTNPVFRLKIPNADEVEQHFDAAALAGLLTPATPPGLTFRSIDLTLARQRSAEIAKGVVVLETDMAGAIKSDPAAPTTRPIRPVTRSPEAIPRDRPKQSAKRDPKRVYGRVENRLEKLGTSLDTFLRERVRTDGRIVDAGIEAAVIVTRGPSGIPRVTLEESEIRATLTAGGLRVDGRIGLSSPQQKVRGEVKVAWDRSDLTLSGSITFSDLVDGLKPITARFEYSPKEDAPRIWADRVEILKTYGGITLHGTATDLKYDVKQGEFSGRASLKAGLGAFGEARADEVRIEANRIVSAQLSYTTPRFTLGKPPALEGDVTGSITYTASETPGGAPKFWGNVTVDAQISAGPLKKLAAGGTLGVVGQVRIAPNGAFSGSLETKTALELGKHFRIPPFTACVKENGDISVAFALQVVNVGLLKNAQVDCLIDDQGFHFERAKALFTIGTEKDRVWGKLGVLYEPKSGFTVGGDINLRINEQMVAFGRAVYNSETGEVDAALGVTKIRLLHYGPKRKSLWDFSKQVELISFFKVVGIYLDVGFELAFLYEFDVWLEPTLFVRGLSFDDFSFRDVRARMKLLGKATAGLEAAPNIGLGIFVISASLLRGGGGIRVPVVGTASLKLDPPLTVDVTYSRDGALSAGGTVGLTLLFGITASVEPYAEIYVLGLWHPSWKWGPIYSVPLLKERPIFTYVVDFGKPLKEETDPPFATTKDAPAAPATTKSVPSEQSGSAAQKIPAALSTIERDPIDQKPEAGNDGGFNLGEMVDKVKNQESFRPIRDVIEVASDIYKVLKFLFGPLIRFVKWLAGGAVELMLKVLRVIRQLGAIIPAVREYLKARLHPVVFDIVSPMLDLMATVEQDLLDLFELTFPRSPGEMINFSFTILKKALKLAWDSLSGLVEAIWDTIKAIGNAVNYFLGLLVEEGRIGVKRHVRYIGSETLGLAKYFLFPDEYKVIDVGGFSVGPKEDDDWYPDPDKAIAASLWLVLHKSDVTPTDNYIEPDTGDPIENYWVARVERKARWSGAPRLTPMVLEAVSVAAAASDGEPLPLSMQRRLQTVPTPELSAIQIHTDDAAAAAAEALDAHAFTVGHDIYFGAGEYRPWTPEGERLLVHEVAHATWEARASWPRYGDRMSVAGDDRERQADAFADALLSSGSTRRT
jgi:hypothetical protein